MVALRRIANLKDNENGASFVEGLLVFPLVLLTFSALVEFGFASFQWNQTVKALQLGARHLAVSDMLVADISGLTSDYPDEEGGPTPADPVLVECGAGAPTPCIGAGIQRLVRGSDGACGANLPDAGVLGVCDFNNRILENNLRITYQRTGLGYVGRPTGPIVTIIIEARDVNFELPIMGALFGLDEISIPANPVTITSEDLSSCREACG